MIHRVTQVEYAQQFSGASITCEISQTKFKARAKNWDWINRANERGTDLSEYKKKMGLAVSSAIMASSTERARRAALMGELNKRPDSHKHVSETAKRTSARPEILARRSAALAAWRKRDPDAFYEKCVSKILSYRVSKPEKWVRDFVQREFPEYEFKGNQRLMSREYFHLTTSQKRQIDVMSKSHKVIVEVDGYLHFNNVPKWNQLEKIQAKDAELNFAAPKMGYTLVRISLDQWNARGELSDASRLKLMQTLSSPDSGLHLIGELYKVTS